LNQDFLDMLSALSEAGADFLRIVIRIIGLNVPTTGREELIQNNCALNRPRDMRAALVAT
jgi:hypothetical protein